MNTKQANTRIKGVMFRCSGCGSGCSIDNDQGGFDNRSLLLYIRDEVRQAKVDCQSLSGCKPVLASYEIDLESNFVEYNPIESHTLPLDFNL